VHQADRLVNDLVLELTCHAYLLPGGAPASFKRRLGSMRVLGGMVDGGYRVPQECY
jgi:hypothetical protein